MAKAESDIVIRTHIKGLEARIDAAPGKRPWVELFPNGRLFVRHGFEWPGDTKTQQALVRSVVYELIRRRILPQSVRPLADLALVTVFSDAPLAVAWRAKVGYWLARAFGWLSLLKKSTISTSDSMGSSAASSSRPSISP